MTDGPKILTLDIESSPHLSWHFDTYRVNISPVQNVVPSRPICWAAKWYGSKKVFFDSEYDTSHAAMLKGIRRLLDQADVVVTYNGDDYDLPRLRWAFDLHAIPQPSPSHSVDLYKLVKKEFRKAPFSKSLAHITDRLDLTGKLSVGAYFPMWLELNSTDEDVRRKAWARFRRYNKRDVVTTEELFERLRDRVSMPAFSLFDEEEGGELACPNCHSEDYQRRGHAYTKTRKYPRYLCQNCGKWFRGVRSERGVSAT